ncbi:neprilysin-11-like isoform X2 [Lycorma delicatula]
MLITVSINYFRVQRVIDNLCNSPECIHSASSILLSIDKSIDPCTDFYHFACGKYNDEHPIPFSSASIDWFSERSERVLGKVTEFLERNNSDTDSLALQKARKMYQACLDTEAMEELDLDPLISVLDDIGLPLVPPLSEKDFDTDNRININKLIADVKLNTGRNIFIYNGIFPDVYNRSTNRITITSPDEDNILPIHGIFRSIKSNSLESRIKRSLLNEDEHAIKAWKNFITIVIKYFVKKTNATTGLSEENIQQTSDRIYKLSSKIQEIANNENITRGNIEKPRKIIVRQLQNETDEAAKSVNRTSKLEWQEYFDTIYSFVNTTVDFNTEELSVYSLEYYKAISKVLANETKYDIVLHIWWDVMFALMPYSNEELRSIRRTFLTESLGESMPLPRESQCSQIIWITMDFALAAGSVEGVDLESIKSDIGQMIDYIQSSFTESLNKADWIDAETKTAILDKSNSVRKNIGIPDWVLDNDEINLFYSELNVTTDHHMENFINFAKVTITNMYKDLYMSHDFSFIEFDPREVNAIYLPQENSMAIPLGILQFPFYNLGLDALNYGALGVIIGHELTHAFDITGRKYDKCGNVKDWWTNETIYNYNERVGCFISLYDDFYVEEAEQSVDGNLTLGENLADNGGLKDAFYGFQKLKQEKPETERKLPGLEEFTSDQLFYIGFAHAWCENWTPKSIAYGLNDEHSPNYVRVLATTKNSKEFSDVWNCPVGSEMNPEEKCNLW